jgi:CRISPR-associated endonuclease Csn1
MKYRIGIDMGSTSIGWCVLELAKDNEIKKVVNAGVRIFSDGRDDKTKEPLAVSRRLARGIRRNRDRLIDDN